MSEESTQGRAICNKYGGVSVGEGGETIVPSDGQVLPANKRRVAACWNSLEGVSTEAVEALDAKGGVLELARKAEKAALHLAAALHENALLRETIERLKP